ncbi:hypothetical protein [Vibrio harveyi]|uniref:hypothetical protein n=1 Tax=Vibrio harveyi TaxID=669 RepID=UPI000683759D|nr:hypothetical protein [Vibrio harveyi]PNM43652.1 hypothetical protein AL469_027775 [Vibrio harveyi]
MNNLTNIYESVVNELEAAMLSDLVIDEKVEYISYLHDELLKEAAMLSDLSKVVMYSTNSTFGPDIQKYILDGMEDLRECLEQTETALSVYNER